MIKSSAAFIVYFFVAAATEMDQRICIKFCVKNEIKCNKVCKMLTKTYGESAMSKTKVYEWYKRFQDGREDVEDDERPGRPSTSTTDENVEKVKEMVMNDRRISIREVADDVGISIEGLRATTTRDARSMVRLFFGQIR